MAWDTNSFGHSLARLPKAERNPALPRKVYKDFRRVLLRRFPYFLYFRIDGDTTVFFLLFHCARHPKGLRGELRERRKNV